MRLARMTVVFIACAVIGVGGVALANHVHVVGHIDHGMGNSNDTCGAYLCFDHILHPYVDVTDNHNITSMRVQLVQSRDGANNDIIRGDWSCSSCKHRHAPFSDGGTAGDVNTMNRWGVQECLFYTNVDSAGGNANHNITLHRHNGAQYCGW